MLTTSKNNTPKVNEGKSFIKLRAAMLLVVLLYSLLTYPLNLHAENEPKILKEKFYSKMTDRNVEIAVENLLFALEKVEDSAKHKWKHGSYSGYIVPFSTFISEAGYFCRDYVEVLIRYNTRYNVYENKACRDHDGEWVWIETSTANKTKKLK